MIVLIKYKSISSLVLIILLLYSMIFTPVGINAAQSGFSDVPESSWYYPHVQFVSDHGLMNGTSESRFEPNAPLTRAMLVTILYRMDGTDFTDDDAVFSDVKDNAWYYNQVAWAADQVIITGYGNGLFGPNDSITREQLAAIMYRYADSRYYSDYESVDLSSFSDESAIHEWAKESVEWAVGTKMISGKGNGILDPLGNATRAEIATIIQRFYERFVEQSDTANDQSGTGVDDYIKSNSQMIIDNPVVADSAAAAADEFFLRT